MLVKGAAPSFEAPGDRVNSIIGCGRSPDYCRFAICIPAAFGDYALVVARERPLNRHAPMNGFVTLQRPAR
jgi:hypothetical protein